MPAASPVGYPAAKRSLRESMMRKALGASERLEFSKLFYNENFGAPLSPDAAGNFREPLELLRLAPSATNKQPWRAVMRDGSVHFYEERSLKPSDLGDIQKVDLGIALCHFDLARQEVGLEGAFVQSDPGIALPANTEYVASFVPADAR
jgi:hypothetical protein